MGIVKKSESPDFRSLAFIPQTLSQDMSWRMKNSLANCVIKMRNRKGIIFK